MNFFDLLGIVAPVFLVLSVGFGLRRMLWMVPESDSSVLKLGVNVLFPALILDTILGNPLLARPSVLWFPPLLAFLVITLSMLLVALLLAPFKLPRATVGAAVVTAGVQNFGYMVIPLVEALFDRETLGLLFVHNLGVEIAMWSIGVWSSLDAPFKRSASCNFVLFVAQPSSCKRVASRVCAKIPAHARAGVHPLGAFAHGCHYL